MAAPAVRPCAPWTDVLPCAPSTATDDEIAFAIAVASRNLWVLSGRKFGVCTRGPLRPIPVCSRCRDVRWFDWATAGLLPYSGRVCDCLTPATNVDTLEVPYAPVVTIAVKVDGATLAAGTDYRLDGFRKLRRLGGFRWPTTQDLSLADTQPGTWSITLTSGRAVPPNGVLAAREWACELLAIGSPVCKLPTRVQQVSRPGITYDMIAPADFLDKGRTGMPLVDSFLMAENPTGQRSPVRVYSAEEMHEFL
jgi:hypothetical protein